MQPPTPRAAPPQGLAPFEEFTVDPRLKVCLHGGHWHYLNLDANIESLMARGTWQTIVHEGCTESDITEATAHTLGPSET